MNPFVFASRMALGAALGFSIGLLVAFAGYQAEPSGLGAYLLALLIGGIGLVTGAIVGLAQRGRDMRDDQKDDYRESERPRFDQP